MVNFDCPNHYEDYVHRCGRTGRAGNKGWAYTFITEEEAKYAGDIVKGNFKNGVKLPAPYFVMGNFREVPPTVNCY